jgi:putative ABC transport system permease protein
MDGIARSLQEAHPEMNANREIVVRDMEEYVTWGWQKPLILFSLVVGLVLLLACANVANLMLAQASARGREIVIRNALGASRGRVIRLLLSESVILSLAGGALGLVLGLLARDLYLAITPEELPYYFRIEMGVPVIAFVSALSLAVGVLFGLAPALESTRIDLFGALREGAELTPGGTRKHRFRSFLVAVQTGLALVVLFGAGMMAKSMPQLYRVPSGIDPDHLLTVRVAMPRPAAGDRERQIAFFDRVTDRIAGLPGVTGVSVVSNLPVGGAAAGTSVHAEGTEAPPPGQEAWIINKVVQPGYFRTMGIGLLRGRDFISQDGATGTPPVVVVNEAFAEHHWPGENPLGKRVKFGRPESEWPWMEIVGVVGDVRHFGLDAGIELGMYEPFQQSPYWRETLVIRSETDPRGLVGAVRQEVTALEPDAPVYDIRTMDRVMYDAHWRPNVYSRLFNLLSAVALVLAALGVYSVVSYTTIQRTREFGIRIALGARRREIVRSAVRQTAVPGGVGMAVGLLVAFVFMRFAGSLMYGVESFDPSMAAGTFVAMAGVALVASYLPARRANRIDPVATLKAE